MQRIRVYRYLIPILFLITSACSTEPMVVSFNESATVQKKQSKQKIDSSNLLCDVYIQKVDDIRNDKNSLGNLGFREILSEDLIVWIKDTFNRNGFIVNNGYSDTNINYKIDISLKLAHIRSSETSKASNLVLAVKNYKLDKLKYYRGRDSSVNWSGDGDEVKKSFQNALSDSIKKITEDINTLCKK